MSTTNAQQRFQTGYDSRPIAGYSADVTLGANDYTVIINAGSGAINVYLPPSASYPGRIYVIKKGESSNYNVIITADGSDTIDGSATKVLTKTAGSDRCTIQSDGAGIWHTL